MSYPEGSLVTHQRARELFSLIGYDGNKAVAIQRNGSREEIRALLNTLRSTIESVEEEIVLAELMYIESIINMLLE